jgi:hypothetical protein
MNSVKDSARPLRILLLLVCGWSSVLCAFSPTLLHVGSPRSLVPRTATFSRPVVPPSPHREKSYLGPTLFRSTPTTASSLKAFLPPSGGGNGKSSELTELATAAVTFLAVVGFLLSPLGGIVFAVFNSLVALAILLPLGGLVAFNVWQYFNTKTGACPNCQGPVKVLKNESPSICFTCGSVVQLKDDNIYLVNTDKLGNAAGNGSIFDSLRGPFRPPTTTTTTVIERKTTIIDVDAKRED